MYNVIDMICLFNHCRSMRLSFLPLFIYINSSRLNIKNKIKININNIKGEKKGDSLIKMLCTEAWKYRKVTYSWQNSSNNRHKEVS